ncbi:endonuclease Q family protein [[Eubacterium] cellulosolvens]
MRVIADLHIHSRYSRATSQNMNLQDLNHYGSLKGLTILGSGDFVHTRWIQELKRQLQEKNDSGFFILKECGQGLLFVLSCEVSTLFFHKKESQNVHHVILTPKLEYAESIAERLSKYGDLSVDGRPILKMSAAELVETVLEISKDNFIFPAHIWTPWFSVLGGNNSFDTIEECYEDQSPHISAIETGLSSDPPMNWRVKDLDRFTLLSNSDSHSAWPWRIGREANVFDLKEPTYGGMIEAIRSKDSHSFLYTIETHPQYGKYHWTGHRRCGISMPPVQALELANRCPRCGRLMVKGVEQRVEELATRKEGEKPDTARNFLHILPLSEIISTVVGVESPGVKRVWSIYNQLIKRYENEFTVLLDADIAEIRSIANDKIADIIDLMRKDELHIVPGYDGVYGRLVLGHAAIFDKRHNPPSLKEGRSGLWRSL